MVVVWDNDGDYNGKPSFINSFIYVFRRDQISYLRGRKYALGIFGYLY